MNKCEKRTQFRTYEAGLLSRNWNIKLGFRLKVLFWNLFDLFYDLDKVISFVTHVSTSTAVYFLEMPVISQAMCFEMQSNLSEDFR